MMEYRAALRCFGWVVEQLPDLVVIEDFVLQPGKQGEYRGGSRAGLSPARIGAMVHGFIMLDGEADGEDPDAGVNLSPGVLWQGPAMIKTMTSARIRAAGLWVVGSQHIRDAACHAYVGYGRTVGATVKTPKKVVGARAKKGAGSKSTRKRVG